MRKKKILFIDSEGGHGGSSRSLFFTVKILDKKIFFPTVLCKRYSQIYEEYKKNKINCFIFENIPKFTSVKREKINLYSFIKFYFSDWIGFYKRRKNLFNIAKNFDHIHFNHISLFLLARLLRVCNIQAKFTMHIRTMPHPNITSRIQARIADKFIDKFIFITENEYLRFLKLTGKKKVRGEIIYNPVERKEKHSSQFNYLKKAKCFNIGLISNYSFMRGTDRIISIIKELIKITEKKFHFIIAGEVTLSNYDKKKLNIKDVSVNNLKDLAIKEDVIKFCTFLGHINNPEDLYTNLNVLLKPTRDNNPWGRDILEAMMYGIPVISVGKYNKFVNKDTGFLMKKFNSEQYAKNIFNLMTNKKLREKLAYNSKATIQKMCSREICKEKFENFWN